MKLSNYLYKVDQKPIFQILDPEGNVINPEFEPKMSQAELLEIYKVMILSRITDTKAFQYQRQGRMLSYVLNTGHEACQVGAASALQDHDWVSPYFRDIGIFLYRKIPLESFLLYWYGNERGSYMDPLKHILPINIIIGSSINIGAGLALSSKLLNKKEVVLATIGDGGSAHEEFYAGLNYASVYKAPLVVAIQNNQYAISTPRKTASNSETLSQKAIAFGIPGMRVDGNDVLAVHVAVKEFVESSRQGNGAGLLELITYRMLGHTTNDNVKLYRSSEEEEEWKLKDPIKRFQKYLLNRKILTQELIDEIEQTTVKYVSEVHQRITTYGHIVKPIEIFEHIYDEMTPQLKEQYEQYELFLKSTEERK
ncbi:MAG: thiamine pyrophosphate-dependent enzyme [Weeping tea tree witches'-broom phytoplasma]|uniref:thiamine pyrophosphate-dependent enzyme n=1 Tax=Candidatus Phytoplasma melaleucae TaxID=2982630 RepID=UPI00293ABE90|nr:thiamine pyrophosphate-dependent enzyme [Weeping tea tree witches'-broom phytoplasma]